MKKAVPVLLLFLLSGIPATAVVCDLLLCVEQAASEVQGCHEHGNQPPDDAISAAARGCTHLADASPFVAPALRLGFDVPAAATPSAATRPLSFPATFIRTFTRPATLPPSSPLALRI